MDDQIPVVNNDAFIVGYGGWTAIRCYPSRTPYWDYFASKPVSFDGEGPGGEGSGYDEYGLYVQDTNNLGNIDNDNQVSIDAQNFLAGSHLVQVTGASITRSLNVPTLNSYYLPHTEEDTARSPIRIGHGTYSYTGDVSFELTEATAGWLFNSDFYERSSWFALQFFDGQNTCTVQNCVWQSISINCSPGGTVKISISFQSNNGYAPGLQVVLFDVNQMIEYNDYDFLVPYWQCGHEGFQEFSFSFERSVTPVYLNNDFLTPSYLKPGLVNVSINATTVEYYDPSEWGEQMVIWVGKKWGIVLDCAVLRSAQYSMSSMNDIGAKSYSWTSISENKMLPVFRFISRLV